MTGHLAAPAPAQLADVPLWRGHQVTAVPASGGLTNENWIVTDQVLTRRYFLKIPGAGTDEFVDRATAHAAGVLASDLGIGPRIVYFDPASGVEVSEFLENHSPVSVLDLGGRELAHAVIDRYRALHSGPLLPGTKTFVDQIDEHLRTVRTLALALPPDAGPLLAHYATARAAFLASGLDLAPCHNDPASGNFLVAPDGAVRLVDFDYASNNDPAYELGVFLAETFADATTTRERIEHFAGRVDRRTEARVGVARALADIKWGLWGLINAAVKHADYDYYKFGVWKLRRARALIHSPTWPDWLAAL